MNMKYAMRSEDTQWRNNQSGGEHWWMNTDGA